MVAEVFEQFNQASIESWSDRTWEAFVLNFLWRVCYNGVRLVGDDIAKLSIASDALVHVRHRDLLLGGDR